MWLGIFLIIFFLFLWYLILKRYFKKQLNKLRRKYNEEENRTNPGRPNLQSTAIRKHGSSIEQPISTELNTKRTDELEGPELLQTSIASDTGQDSIRDTSTDTSHKRTIGKLFKRK